MILDLNQVPIFGVNVKNFGANGDGKNDDSVPIQKALDSKNELIVIPYGSYKINKTLKISSNTHLYVHPQAKLFLGDRVGLNNRCFLLTNKNIEKGDSNIIIEGGIWDGNNIETHVALTNQIAIREY